MKLLASDIDGTLYRNYFVSNDIKKFIDEFAKRNIFILATGRNFFNFLLFIKKEEIQYNYSILCNGAFVLDNNFKVILNKKFKKIYIKDILYNLYLMEKNTEIIASHEFEQIIHLPYEKIETFYARLPDQINSLNLKLPKNNNKFINYLKKKEDLSFEYNNNYIDIIPKNINKGMAVELIRKNLKIKREDTFAIGDSENDFSMFDVVENSFYINKKKGNSAKYNVSCFEELINHMIMEKK